MNIKAIIAVILIGIGIIGGIIAGRIHGAASGIFGALFFIAAGIYLLKKAGERQ